MPSDCAIMPFVLNEMRVNEGKINVFSAIKKLPFSLFSTDLKTQVGI